MFGTSRDLVATGALFGSKTMTWRSLMPRRAASMRGRTSAQFSPPRPLPSGGMAMERMPRLRISSTSAFRPESISSIRLLPRQWRLVGKLMMNFGFVSVRVSNTNILPGCTSSRAQAAS